MFDLIDKKLLYYLDCNARMSYTQLARKARISKEVARYRIKRLENEGFIQKYDAIINYLLLGQVIRIYYDLYNLTDKKISEIISFLKRKRLVIWMGHYDGTYDLGVVVVCSDMPELNDFLLDFNQKFSKEISRRTILTLVEGSALPRKYLLDTKKKEEEHLFSHRQNEEVRLDKTDETIINLLKNDARISTIDIALKTKKDIDTIRKRIKQLIKRGIITKFRLILNEEKIGRINYKLLITYGNIDAKNEAVLKMFCETHPLVVYFNKVIGEWDYEIDIEATTIKEYRAFLQELKETMENKISKTERLVLLNQRA